MQDDELDLRNLSQGDFPSAAARIVDIVVKRGGGSLDGDIGLLVNGVAAMQERSPSLILNSITEGVAIDDTIDGERFAGVRQHVTFWSWSSTPTDDPKDGTGMYFWCTVTIETLQGDDSKKVIRRPHRAAENLVLFGGREPRGWQYFSDKPMGWIAMDLWLQHALNVMSVSLLRTGNLADVQPSAISMSDFVDTVGARDYGPED